MDRNRATHLCAPPLSHMGCPTFKQSKKKNPQRNPHRQPEDRAKETTFLSLLQGEALWGAEVRVNSGLQKPEEERREGAGSLGLQNSGLPSRAGGGRGPPCSFQDFWLQRICLSWDLSGLSPSDNEPSRALSTFGDSER